MNLPKVIFKTLEKTANYFLQPFGIFIQLNYTYPAVYFFGRENIQTRVDEKTGREDAEFLSQYVNPYSRVLDFGCGGVGLKNFCRNIVRKFMVLIFPLLL